MRRPIGLWTAVACGIAKSPSAWSGPGRLSTLRMSPCAAELPTIDGWRPVNGRPITNGHAPDALAAYREYQETMRRFLSSQEQVVSNFLSQLGGTRHAPESFGPILEASPTQSGPRVTPEEQMPALDPPAQAETLVPWTDRESATRFLQALVSEQTGYPVEVLGIHQDLESELGIDSLKRIEILADFRNRLPAEVGDRLQAQMDSLTRVRTLGAIIDAVLREVGATATQETRTEPSAPAATPSRTASTQSDPDGMSRGDHPPGGRLASCPRLVMTSRERTLSGPKVPCAEGLILVTEDGLGVAGPLLEELRASGLTPCLVPRQSLLETESLGRLVSEVRAAHGPIRGLIHLASLKAPDDRADSDELRREVRTQTKGLFHLIRLAATDLGRRGPSPGARPGRDEPWGPLGPRRRGPEPIGRGGYTWPASHLAGRDSRGLHQDR